MREILWIAIIAIFAIVFLPTATKMMVFIAVVLTSIVSVVLLFTISFIPEITELIVKFNNTLKNGINRKNRGIQKDIPGSKDDNKIDTIN